MRENKLDLIMLIAIGIGAIVATGVYGMPADMASVASPFATVIAWIITIIGILSLAYVFKLLSDKKPEIKGGQFAYAKEGFGDYAGTLIGWGYYVSVIFTIIACLIATSDILVYFYQIFTDSKTDIGLAKLILTSISIWLVFRLLCLGTEEIGLASITATACKLIPLVIFIAIVFVRFDSSNFTYDLYGRLRYDEIGGLYKQVESLASVNLWLLLGFEIIGIVSARAKGMKDVGNATIVSVVVTLFLYLMISIGSLGVMTTKELSSLEYPSAAYVLGSIIGNKGEIMINFSILISAAGALIAWTFAAVEIVSKAAKEGLFFRELGKENNGVPKIATFVVCITLQILVVFTYFSPKTYSAVSLIATSSAIIPYLISTIFAIKVVIEDKTYKKPSDKMKDMSVLIIAASYLVWLIYAARMHNLLFVIVIYAIGVMIYIVNTIRNKRIVFNKVTAKVSVVIIIASIISIYLQVNGIV